MARYHPLLVTLHWLLAVLIITSLIMGSQVLAKTPNDDPFKLTSLAMHMSVGILILALMLFRLVLRMRTRRPPEADIGNAMLNKGASLAHWLFYLVVIAMCASGIGISILAGLPDIVFGGSGDPLPASFDQFAPRVAHGILAWVLTVLIAGHFLAALYHHFVRKDGLLKRMWYGNRNG